jgi:competence CoiA-like predicted nuclease
MPLKGKLKSTGDEVYVFRLENPRREIAKGDLVCPLCDGDMHLVQCVDRATHFRHHRKCTSELTYHPESQEHLVAKRDLLKLLCDRYRGDLKRAETERPLPQIGRVADIYLEFKSGWTVIHEIQLSSVTTGELEERTRDYREGGHEVYWWLGNDAHTTPNQKWCVREIGQCGSLTFGSRELRLKT